MRREPAAIVGAIAALVQAALVVAVAFGLHLTADQITALAALAAVVVPLVQAIVTRSKVYAPATVDAAVAAADADPEVGAYQPRRAAVEGE